jgi:hypothetical protein
MTEASKRFFGNAVNWCRRALVDQQASKKTQASQHQQLFWTIWLGAARAGIAQNLSRVVVVDCLKLMWERIGSIELLNGHADNTWILLERAEQCAPIRSKSIVILELARSLEYEARPER